MKNTDGIKDTKTSVLLRDERHLDELYGPECNFNVSGGSLFVQMNSELEGIRESMFFTRKQAAALLNLLKPFVEAATHEIKKL